MLPLFNNEISQSSIYPTDSFTNTQDTYFKITNWLSWTFSIHLIIFLWLGPQKSCISFLADKKIWPVNLLKLQLDGLLQNQQNTLVSKERGKESVIISENYTYTFMMRLHRLSKKLQNHAYRPLKNPKVTKAIFSVGNCQLSSENS